MNINFDRPRHASSTCCPCHSHATPRPEPRVRLGDYEKYSSWDLRAPAMVRAHYDNTAANVEPTTRDVGTQTDPTPPVAPFWQRLFGW